MWLEGSLLLLVALFVEFVPPFICVGTYIYRCSVYAGMVQAYIMLGLSLSHAVKICIPVLDCLQIIVDR